MGLNNAEYIDGLNPNDPTFQDRVVDAASHLRAIKKALQQTFPNVNGAVTEGPDGLNGFEARIAALEGTLGAFTQQGVASGRLSINTSAGNYSVTGLGFQPTLLVAMAAGDDTVLATLSANYSIGFTDGTNQYSLSGTSDDTYAGDRTYQSASYLLDMYGSNETSAARVTIVSLDSDGFTVNESLGLWDIDITWMAFE
jgi:hypothetical protein